METYTLGIRIVYEGRHSTLIIFLQPNKNIALVNNMQTLKKYSDIFSELGTNPTPVELGLPQNCPISCPILDFVDSKSSTSSCTLFHDLGRKAGHIVCVPYA